MNTVALTGRLAYDPELRTTPNDKSVCRLRLAVDRMGRDDEAGYIDVATFGKSAEACARILSKGWLVAVDGRLEHRTWTTDAGDKRSAIQVVGHVEFLKPPKGTAQTHDDTPPDADLDRAGDDDIPF